ncbi:hypothetical protein NIIDMKKI_18520 [Mycobacterium kansasii]|uniref:Uncharacterized protein n=1 Tax=Mycobacterium kansasii TaxID=1768 RepID=A0A7G1I6L9_MYCKA|nr:hypothetical protein NIIDMKKI_18520 [Mycobacterium kansasii]
MAFLPAQFRPLPLGGKRDLTSDMAAEQVTHPLALPQAVDHRVETTLQLTELGSVEHHQVAAEIPSFHALQCRSDHAYRCRREPGQDPHQDKPEDQCCHRHDKHADRELGCREIPHPDLEDRDQGNADDGNTRSQQPHHHGSPHDSRCQSPGRRSRLERLGRYRT